MSRKHRLTISQVLIALQILFIGFITLFSFDVFDMEGSLVDKILGFLIHNIPSFVLILILLLSLKRELIGAIAYFVMAVLYILFAVQGAPDLGIALVWSLTIAGPAILISAVFWCSHKSHKNARI